MPGPDFQLFNELKKEMKDSPVTLPSMGEMIRNAAEGFNFAAQGEKLYAVAAHKQPELATGHVDTFVFGRFMKRIRQGKEDQALRDSMKHQGVKTITDEEVQRELSFREKEESYNKKEKDQEKDAIERNEQLEEVPLQELQDKADELRTRLQDEIDDDDTLALGQREYQKQYLQVVEDLQDRFKKRLE